MFATLFSQGSAPIFADQAPAFRRPGAQGQSGLPEAQRAPTYSMCDRGHLTLDEGIWEPGSLGRVAPTPSVPWSNGRPGHPASASPLPRKRTSRSSLVLAHRKADSLPHSPEARGGLSGSHRWGLESVPNPRPLAFPEWHTPNPNLQTRGTGFTQGEAPACDTAPLRLRTPSPGGIHVRLVCAASQACHNWLSLSHGTMARQRTHQHTEMAEAERSGTGPEPPAGPGGGGIGPHL